MPRDRWRRRVARSTPGGLGFPHLLASTVALLFATILLGVATKAHGAGLACEANWPLCDGGVLDLFPAGVPSFFEWIHRVVAMVAGLLVVASTLAAWAGAVGDRRLTWALTAGAALTPVQVYLGRETVLAYELAILNWHFWVAVAIFTLFGAAAVVVWRDRLSLRHVSTALASAATLVVVAGALSPLFVVEYTPVVQTLQYAVVLALLFGGLVAAIAGPPRVAGRRLRVALRLAPALALGVIYFGREAVMGYDPTLAGAYVLLSVVTLVAFVGTAWRVRAVPEPPEGDGSVAGTRPP